MGQSYAEAVSDESAVLLHDTELHFRPSSTATTILVTNMTHHTLRKVRLHPQLSVAILHWTCPELSLCCALRSKSVTIHRPSNTTTPMLLPTAAHYSFRNIAVLLKCVLCRTLTHVAIVCSCNYCCCLFLFAVFSCVEGKYQAGLCRGALRTQRYKN
jgi:hypothetical protein